jgi:competence protein ComEA
MPGEPAHVPELSRAQLALYAVIAIAILVVGARWIRSGDSGSAGAAELSFAADTSRGQSDGDVVVHVAGAVRRPGVYRLPAGSRVTDAVKRAGGFAGTANQDGINLAARLSDGQQVVVPAPGSAAAAEGSGQSGPISLGSATVGQLDQIESIGPVTAQKIVDFRDEHGGLSSIDQLDEVDGIGPSTMQTLRSSLQP